MHGWTTTSARSFRALECMLSGPIGLYTFNLMRWSQSCSTLNVGGILHPQPLLGSFGTREVWEVWLALKTKANNSLSVSAFSVFEEDSFPFSGESAFEVLELFQGWAKGDRSLVRLVGISKDFWKIHFWCLLEPLV